MPRDYYEVLGVSREANDSTGEPCFATLAARFHMLADRHREVFGYDPRPTLADAMPCWFADDGGCMLHGGRTVTTFDATTGTVYVSAHCTEVTR